MSLHIDTCAPSDFDFIIGHWTVKHSRLSARLCNCREWIQFAGRSSCGKILGGFGNIEDAILEFPDDTFRAAAVRSYCTKTKTWSIWWLDGRNPTQLDIPVVGGFNDHVGLFFADDVLNGKAIKVRFTWTATSDQNPRWEQAFSDDGGETWETNWIMEFAPAIAETQQGR
jgi:hypothetical protein